MKAVIYQGFYHTKPDEKAENPTGGKLKQHGIFTGFPSCFNLPQTTGFTASTQVCVDLISLQKAKRHYLIGFADSIHLYRNFSIRICNNGNSWKLRRICRQNHLRSFSIFMNLPSMIALQLHRLPSKFFTHPIFISVILQSIHKYRH